MTTFKTTETRTWLNAECDSCKALFTSPVSVFGHLLVDHFILTHKCQVPA